MILKELLALRPLVAEELSADQKKALVKDFKEWSGGFGPNDCEPKQINDYLRTSLDSSLNKADAKRHLMDMMTEGKNHMGDKEYQSVAAWKRAIKAKHGDEVKYHAHEGTIDAMVGKKQVGHWDDTIGTLFEGKDIPLAKREFKITKKPSSAGKVGEIIDASWFTDTHAAPYYLKTADRGPLKSLAVGAEVTISTDGADTIKIKRIV